ncbi:hypothetical protein ACIQVC_39220 [Streptomyces sp. NPDC101112]|jgi:hypothetical protein|uniref:hypothetical protein n=1 Tax=unclassified Streptomyces TaxID=2593676 RepID=UPI000D2D3BD3|nr:MULTISPECIES: hypothetical protein [unclassified Streptomyces]SPF06853.1 hypothetical protein SMA5143A_7697 [Streptomyces sp. MA5143a]
MASHHSTERPTTPFMEFRAGGVHLVVQRPPYRLLSLLGSLAGVLGGAYWFGGR